jgi:hypothetical protein
LSSLFQELKRRNVFRVAIAYIAVAWLVLQVSDIVFESFGTPDWVMKTLMFVLAIGFPLAVLFAWAFEMTPEGIKKEKDVDRTQSITSQTGQKLNSASCSQTNSCWTMAHYLKRAAILRSPSCHS